MPDLFTSAESYNRFMGRFSEPLAECFAGILGLEPGMSALDVGCGPGALTRVLVDVLGPERVSAVDPAVPFVRAAQERFPGVDVRVASAEALPFADGGFDVAASQLVVHFLADPVAGIAELARVTRPGGTVAATVWDFSGGRGPLGVFDRATHDLDPSAPTERDLPGSREGELAELFERAGLVDVVPGELTITVEFATFDDWWQPFTLGVGPAGAYVASLDPASRERLQDHARELIPEVPFAIDATAWSALGRTPR